MIKCEDEDPDESITTWHQDTKKDEWKVPIIPKIEVCYSNCEDWDVMANKKTLFVGVGRLPPTGQWNTNIIRSQMSISNATGPLSKNKLLNNVSVENYIPIPLMAVAQTWGFFDADETFSEESLENSRRYNGASKKHHFYDAIIKAVEHLRQSILSGKYNRIDFVSPLNDIDKDIGKPYIKATKRLAVKHINSMLMAAGQV